MSTSTTIHKFQAGCLNIEVHRDSTSAGEAAAREAACCLARLGQQTDQFGVIFATGSSQLSMLAPLISTPNLPWSQTIGFHLDEYIGMPVDHPASFRGYLREHLLSKVRLKKFYEIDGEAPDIDEVCTQYSKALRTVNPQLCLLGIGENGHLAFNDPEEANFEDPVDVRVVHLDTLCRQQQASEGWFSSIDEVPKVAITVTIPALFRVPKLVLTVPGSRKAEAVRQVIEGPIATSCPASILRRHPNATLHVDLEAATLIMDKIPPA